MKFTRKAEKEIACIGGTRLWLNSKSEEINMIVFINSIYIYLFAYTQNKKGSYRRHFLLSMRYSLSNIIKKFISFRNFTYAIRMYICRRFIVCIYNTLGMRQVKGGRMHTIFWILIALIGITPKVLRELGIILYIVLKYKRRHW